MVLRTFKKWSDFGYKILKGSKSVHRNKDNVPLFSDQQVEKYYPVFYAPELDYEPYYRGTGQDD